LFDQALKWVRNFPGGFGEKEKSEVRRLICETFGLSAEDLLIAIGDGIEVEKVLGLDPRLVESELRDLIPKGGFFDRYAEYTEHSEAPLAFHLFCALVAVGVTVNRRCWFNMGYYKLYPNLSIIILGPSGIKKTSAANIAIGMLQALELSKIYSEKLTPEQLVESMKEHAQGLVYAPELSVFLGKQRYMEGTVPLLTRLLDCPDVWSSETIGRGKTTLHDVAISTLMCSTPAWFIDNTPEDMVTGGFVPRNILVVQEDSPRVERIPRPGNPKLKETLTYELSRIHEVQGELRLDQQTDRAHEIWYSRHKEQAKHVEHELLSTYYQRKPDHVLRVAFCLHLAEHLDLTVCLECFTRAVEILNWTERFLPGLIRTMFKTASGHGADVVLQAIRTGGGVIDHSELLRRLQHRYNGPEVKGIIASLKDSGMIDEHIDKLQHLYYIKRRDEK
jgi:hypothetical protein